MVMTAEQEKKPDVAWFIETKWEQNRDLAHHPTSKLSIREQSKWLWRQVLRCINRMLAGNAQVKNIRNMFHCSFECSLTIKIRMISRHFGLPLTTIHTQDATPVPAGCLLAPTVLWRVKVLRQFQNSMLIYYFYIEKKTALKLIT